MVGRILDVATRNRRGLSADGAEIVGVAPTEGWICPGRGSDNGASVNFGGACRRPVVAIPGARGRRVGAPTATQTARDPRKRSSRDRIRQWPPSALQSMDGW